MQIPYDQRRREGAVLTIEAGASEVVPVSGCRGTVVYSDGGSATVLPCDGSGTGAPGATAADATLGNLNPTLSTHQKITAATAACQVHLLTY